MANASIVIAFILIIGVGILAGVAYSKSKSIKKAEAGDVASLNASIKALQKAEAANAASIKALQKPGTETGNAASIKALQTKLASLSGAVGWDGTNLAPTVPVTFAKAVTMASGLNVGGDANIAGIHFNDTTIDGGMIPHSIYMDGTIAMYSGGTKATRGQLQVFKGPADSGLYLTTILEGGEANAHPQLIGNTWSNTTPAS